MEILQTKIKNVPRKKGRQMLHCGKTCHYVKNCPKNQKGIKLISDIQNEIQIPLSDIEFESLEQEEISAKTLFALQFLYDRTQYSLCSV